MYSEKHNHIGEHPSTGEEILNEIPELEQKFRAVEKSVSEGYFSFSEALLVYGMGEIEYISCLFLKNNQKLQMATKQEQVFETLFAIASIFDQPNSGFDVASKEAIDKIKEITRTSAKNKKSLLEMVNF